MSSLSIYYLYSLYKHLYIYIYIYILRSFIIDWENKSIFNDYNLYNLKFYSKFKYYKIMLAGDGYI